MSSKLLAGACMALLATAAAAQESGPIKLNDTGMEKCVSQAGTWTTKCAGSGQDGAYGRDATAPSNGDGHAGFKYAKISGSGELLPRSAKNWRCVADRVTGLVWEVKAANGGPLSVDRIYTNYGDGRKGDTSELVAKVNAESLCGASNWRVPTILELQSLLNYGASTGASIDADWFPNTREWWYWASTEYGTDPEATWGVYFSATAGGDGAARREFKLSVRLVHSAQ